MTLCMAALCQDEKEEGGPLVVVAADRMVTYGGFLEARSGYGRRRT